MDDRQEGAQLGAVPGRPDRRVAQGEEGRVEGAADEDDRERRPAHPQQGTGRGAEPGEKRPDRDQHRQRRADHQRLRLRVVAAERQRDQVEQDAGGERDRHGELAPPHPPGGAEDQRQGADRPGEAGEVGASRGVEPVVRGGPDPERLDRRDRPVGVAAGDLVEAAAEAEGPDQRQHAEPGEDEQGDQRARPPQGTGQRPRRQRPAHAGLGEAPEDDDRDRPGEAGEAVGEEDAAGQRQVGEQEAQRRPAAAGRGHRVAQRQGEGEDEERLGGLLESALGEVGGGEVGERDHRRRQRAAHPAEVAQRGQRGQPDHDADREDLAEEGLAQRQPRHRGDGDRQPVRPQRVAGEGHGPEAAAQPLGPGQVEAEVVVEADADHAPAAADQEGDRQHQGDGDRDRQAARRAPGAS